MRTERCGVALLAAALLLGACVSEGEQDDTTPASDTASDPTSDAASNAVPDAADGAEDGEDQDPDQDEGEAPQDPPVVGGQSLSAEAVTDELVALLDADLADDEVCAAMGLDETVLRDLSRSDEGDDDLADDAPMDDDVFDGFIGCTAPTSVVVDDEPMTMPGVGVDLYRFDPTPQDAAIDGDVVTTPAGRTARLGGFAYDPGRPEAGRAVTWTIYSLERGAAVRVSGHERSQGTTPEALGGLLDEVLDRFA